MNKDGQSLTLAEHFIKPNHVNNVALPACGVYLVISFNDVTQVIIAKLHFRHKFTTIENLNIFYMAILSLLVKEVES